MIARSFIHRSLVVSLAVASVIAAATAKRAARRSLAGEKSRTLQRRSRLLRAPAEIDGNAKVDLKFKSPKSTTC